MNTSRTEIIDRSMVGVYLPNRPHKEPYRLPRSYARQMRDMNLAYFINHTKDVRLRFTPDPREPFPKAMMIPGENLGINHKIAATGISLRPPKRTKTRCIRTVTYSPTQCGDNNHGDRRASA